MNEILIEQGKEAAPDHQWPVDATLLNLPDSEETRERYTGKTNQHDQEGVVQGMGSFLYDVLNGVTINSVLDSKRSEKSFVLREHSAHFISEAIVLYDRLYADYAVIGVHVATGVDFVIRARSSQTFKEVETFISSLETDRIVTLSATAKQKWWVEKLGLPRQVRVRLVKVVLDDGTVEVLWTSLYDVDKYPAEEFKSLYAKRWG